MKYSPHFIECLRKRLKSPLPGLDAQMDLAPPVRGREWIVPDDARKSAVLALLYPSGPHIYLAFMKRTDDGRVHSGQVCFPGGGREEHDPTYTFTALRETEEELGVSPETIDILGALTELYIPPSNSLVYPKVGFCAQRPDFSPDAVEVAAVIEVPVCEFLDDTNIGVHTVDVHAGTYIQAPGYTVQGHLIWGATAMIIAELMSIIREVKESGSR